jgi:hypothetical protein
VCPAGMAQTTACTATTNFRCITPCINGTSWNDGNFLACQACAFAPCPVGREPVTVCSSTADVFACSTCANGTWNNGAYAACQPFSSS